MGIKDAPPPRPPSPDTHFAPLLQEVLIVADSEDLTPMMMVNSSIATPHGKCNAVYVGIVPSETQVAELKAYSTQYKVRKCLVCAYTAYRLEEECRG